VNDRQPHQLSDPSDLIGNDPDDTPEVGAGHLADAEPGGLGRTASAGEASSGIHTPDLRSRAIAAAADLYRADPQEFRRRHAAWNRWVDHVAAARRLALALGVPGESVTTHLDPVRRDGPAGRYPGLLFTLTEPSPFDSRPGAPYPDTPITRSQPGGRQWRFIPDLATGSSWLLLDGCPACDATAVPIARIACLADLGDYLDPPAGDDFEHLPYDFNVDPAHDPDCPAHVGTETDGADPTATGRVVIATWRPNAEIWTTRVLGPSGRPMPVNRRAFTSDRALRRYAASLHAALRYESTSATPPTDL
jgi:hypothetical protein